MARLGLGGHECVELREYTPAGRAKAPGERSNDLSFQHMAIVVRDMDAAYARVRAAHARQVSTEPQRIPDWNEAAAGIRAFYFRDPDDHNLELIWFPKGKGAPRWQAPGDGAVSRHRPHGDRGRRHRAQRRVLPRPPRPARRRRERELRVRSRST